MADAGDLGFSPGEIVDVLPMGQTADSVSPRYHGLSEARMKAFTFVIYAVFGALAVSAGTAALLVPALALPREMYSPMTAHLIREQAAGFVFIGLMLFWCLSHFEQRRPVHFALLLFTGLFAAIHWVDYLREHRDVLSPVINTLPVLALVATAPFARRSAHG